MNRIFIYQTLKQKQILEEALGENHGKVLTPAHVYDYTEVAVYWDHETWPTLRHSRPGTALKGDIITVSDSELEKLRAWEKNYKLTPVKTDQGEAMAFMFDAMNRIAPLGDVARWKLH
jgi:hypothetical protein